MPSLIFHPIERDEEQTATLPDGRVIRRKTGVYIPEWHSFVKVMQYDKHFIYENKMPNQPAYMCTCGSVAGVHPRGPNGLFRCLKHLDTGAHNV